MQHSHVKFGVMFGILNWYEIKDNSQMALPAVLASTVLGVFAFK